MRRILTTVLTLSWAAVFTLLALAVLPAAGHQSLSIPDLLGLQAQPLSPGVASSDLVRYLLTLFFLSTGVVFFWAFTVSLSERRAGIESGDDVNRAAFAAGAGALVLGMLGGALALVPGLFNVAMISLTALVVSYVATFLERVSLLMASEAGSSDVRAAARLMAMGAAHSSMLSRISGRDAPRRERGGQ